MQSPNAQNEELFHAFEQAGWESIPKQYDDGFGRLTSQAIEPLLDAAEVAAGTRVLDVATGPGYVAAAAASRGALVVGVDFAAAMVAEARRRHPALDFRMGDAEELPFPNDAFDAVVMNFGMLHLARPDQAIAEARRVLRPGGRFAFTVWANPEHTIGFGIVLNAVRAHGNMDVPLPAGPPFFRFSDTDECVRTLLEIGFAQPSVTRIQQIWRLDSPDALYEIMSRGTVRTAGLLRAQTPDALSAIRGAVRNATASLQNGDAFELPMPAVLASARRPVERSVAEA
ncbi:MAG: class I SAM-dependent methyltransferase [Verrucomicrobia bacterium]|nr:class I SAM-dependent methyltransferase [Verrucomicrobiota bacterium]